MTTAHHRVRGQRRSAPVLLSNWLLATSVAALMAACSGGGDGNAPLPGLPPPAPAAPPAPPPAPPTSSLCDTPPEGIQPPATVRAAVGGAIVGRTDPSFILLQVPDTVSRGFDRWLIYGPDLAQAPVVTGVIYSSGGVGCNGNDRTAVNGRDRGTGESVYLRTEISDRGADASLLDGGSLRYRTSPPVTYALGPRPLPGVAPNHALAPALLANVVGSWTLKDVSRVGMSLDVAADGALTLSYRGCTLKGDLRVGDGGLYTVTTLHEPASCTNSIGVPYEGVALAYPLATGGWQMLFTLSANNGVDFDDILAIGRR